MCEKLGTHPAVHMLAPACKCMLLRTLVAFYVVIQAKDAKVFMVVRALETHTNQWSVINPNGSLPPQRGGHSVSASCN